MKEDNNMKKYIKPNTSIHDIELQNMIAFSGDSASQTETPNAEEITNPGTFADGKEGGISFWGDSAEEE